MELVQVISGVDPGREGDKSFRGKVPGKLHLVPNYQRCRKGGYRGKGYEVPFVLFPPSSKVDDNLLLFRLTKILWGHNILLKMFCPLGQTQMAITARNYIIHRSVGLSLTEVRTPYRQSSNSINTRVD